MEREASPHGGRRPSTGGFHGRENHQSAQAPGELELYTRGAAAELISWRDQLIRKLQDQGALILDVDPSGLTPALINRYLEIKARHLL